MGKVNRSKTVTCPFYYVLTVKNETSNNFTWVLWSKMQTQLSRRHINLIQESGVELNRVRASLKLDKFTAPSPTPIILSQLIEHKPRQLNIKISHRSNHFLFRLAKSALKYCCNLNIFLFSWTQNTIDRTKFISLLSLARWQEGNLSIVNRQKEISQKWWLNVTY